MSLKELISSNLSIFFKSLKKREIVVRSILAFLIRGFGALSTVILSTVVARILSPEDAGQYFLSFTIIQVIATTGQLGLPHTFLRFIGISKADRDWKQVSAIYKIGTIWIFLFTLILTCIFWVITPWLAVNVLGNPEIIPVMRAISPSITLIALFTLNAYAFQALGDVVKSVLILNISVPLLLSLFLLFKLGNTAYLTAALHSLASLITLSLAIFLWFYKPSIRWWDVKSISYSSIWRSCLPLWLVMLMGQAIQWGGQLVAGAYAPPDEIAMLSIAQRTSMLASFILMAVNLVIAPKFASLFKQRNFNELEHLAMHTTKLMVIFALPIVIFMILYPKLLMSLFGNDYLAGVNLLRILAIGQFINVLTGSVDYLLSMSGHERDLRNIVLISGPVSIFASLLLIPLYGVYGAAIATALALSLQKLLTVWMVKHRLGFNTLAVWRKMNVT